MASTGSSLPPEQVRQELKRLRQGQGLAHPSAVLQLGPALRGRLAGPHGHSATTPENVVQIVAALRRGIDGLSKHERQFALVDFNLAADHSYPTLTERQESLAQTLKCAAKTVRRHSDKAIETLSLILVTDRPELLTPLRGAAQPAAPAERMPWHEQLGRFWKLSARSRVDIVCSELPADERPYYASPHDRNYLRYAKFADLDSLIYVRTRLSQAFRSVVIRDFSPSEYFDTDADTLIVIGGPPWNAKYREFLPQLPYHFDPHPLGEDDPLVVPQLGDLTMRPRWTDRNELLEDLAVFTRVTLVQGTTAFLLGGCLTLGVLGAAKCFLQGERGAGNAQYVTDMVGDDDFVLVTEARRIGGITDMSDLTVTNPLLLLARGVTGPFTVVVRNTDRYTG